MALETQTLRRINETPRDKPVSERTEHANLDRPGAQAHPSARSWRRSDAALAWRQR